MKLIEAIKKNGSPYKVENCGRNELPEFLKQMGFKTGAEIGVYKAEYLELFCKAGLKMYGIDPWKAYEGAGRTQQRQERQDFIYGHASRLVAPYNDCTLIRKESMDALEDFEDESLDFIYIDGDHDFKHIAEDIPEWSKKVKKGGIISGHDYFCTDPGATNVVCQVGAVVDAYTKAFDIKNFYVFGRTKPLKEEKRYDKTLSWFWFKK